MQDRLPVLGVWIALQEDFEGVVLAKGVGGFAYLALNNGDEVLGFLVQAAIAEAVRRRGEGEAPVVRIVANYPEVGALADVVAVTGVDPEVCGRNRRVVTFSDDDDVIALADSNVDGFGTIRFDWDEVGGYHVEVVTVDPEGKMRRDGCVDDAHLVGVAFDEFEFGKRIFASTHLIQRWAAIVRTFSVE